MNLLNLNLQNFKGLKSFELNTNGANAEVYGDNATGKTTLADAWSWLLFDKDSQGKKDFDIKPLDATGKVVPGLQVEVEGTVEHNGIRTTLKKVYAEKWTKKRGSITSEFTGHETNHFINGVPVKKNEYVAKVAELAGNEEVFKLLTSPAYFNEILHWTDRRKTLLDVCGDLTDAEVIASDEKLAKLPDILGNHSLEELRKIIAARRTELNKAIEQIPTRIDEVNRNLPDISGLIESELIGDIASDKGLLKTYQEQLLQVQSGGEIAQRKIEIANIEGELLRLKNEHQSKVDAQVKEKRTELTNIELRIDGHLKRTISVLTSDVTTNLRKIDNLALKRESLVAQWKQINAETLAFDQETVCPTCGQDIPECQLAEAREKAGADFNEKKAAKLEANKMDGLAVKAEREQLEQANADMQKQVDDLKVELEQATQAANELHREIEAIRQANTEIPGYAEKLQAKTDIEAAIRVAQEGSKGEADRLRGQITEIETQIREMEKSLADIKRHEDGQKRVEELKAQEKKLAAEYAKLEGELYLTEQFIRTKVSLLEEKINSRFKYARFKLFDVQINGGVNECCETVFNGVPYGSGLNNAAKINVGLDIINTLSEHYGFTAPIFIDNAESVTKLIETRAQTISLVVSEADKTMRVETEQRKAEVA